MDYKLKKHIISFYSSFQSRKLDKKIIIFESDDWGSIRTPSLEVVKSVQKFGNVNNDVYTQFDTLENSADLSSLIEVLNKYQDSNKKHPVLTTNFVMANPDFEKILKSNFRAFYYKTFDKTYREYYPNEAVFSKLEEGIKGKYFFPQFHGREHVNVPFWLHLLQKGNLDFMDAFKNQFWGIKTKELKEQNKSIQASFDLNNKEGQKYIQKAIQEGLQIFQEKFGYKSKSFIPNNYIWPVAYNALLKELGVNFLQGVRIQLAPQENLGEKRKSVRRIPGNVEKGGLISIVRNGTFEPSFYPENRRKALDMCLVDIESAFRWKQPAVISTHRINYVSGLDVKNRDDNLKLFEELLKTVIKKWPDVQFMTTVELGDLYKCKLSKE